MKVSQIRTAVEHSTEVCEHIARELANRTVAVWSPHDAFQGAATLLRVLDEDKAAS